MVSKYFIFDMDETLAELYSVYYFIASFHLKTEKNISESFTKGYKLFVEEILKREISKQPLGILRPGILNIMKTLSELQRNGKIKNVIIYSNNGHLESLEFIKDLIHKYIGSNNLIKECIHWDHPMRDEERTLEPGMANKTWNVLRNIMVNGNCQAPTTVQPTDVFFFDDLDHKDLQKNLGINYYKVPGYSFKASFDRIADIYQSVIRVTHIDIEELGHYIVETLVGSTNDYEKIVAKEDIMEGILDFFKSKTRGTASDFVMPPSPDRGIEMMEEAITRANLKSGGRRKMRINRTYRKVKQFRIRTRVKKN